METPNNQPVEDFELVLISHPPFAAKMNLKDYFNKNCTQPKCLMLLHYFVAEFVRRKKQKTRDTMLLTWHLCMPVQLICPTILAWNIYNVLSNSLSMLALVLGNPYLNFKFEIELLQSNQFVWLNLRKAWGLISHVISISK